MEPSNPGKGEQNPDPEKKVSISGPVTIRVDGNGFDNIVNAIRQETRAEHETENEANRISRAQVDEQQRANNIAIVAMVVSILVNTGHNSGVYHWIDKTTEVFY
jgi:hypothetical protein